MSAASDLFEGRGQLYIKHFMMASGAQHQCVGCSLEVDHMTDILPHIENHDVSYAAIARAPIEEIEAVRKRMGWKFLWVSRSAATSVMTFRSHSSRRTLPPGVLSTTTGRRPNGPQPCRICRAAPPQRKIPK